MKKTFIKNCVAGFSLVELVVVIAIIGLLTSVVLASTNASHQNARDERRISDLKEIQIDLAQYDGYYGQYPSTLSAMGSFVVGGLGNIPVDPLTGQAYFYAPYAPASSGSLNVSYCIGATLETQSPADNAKSACTTEGITNAVNYMQQPPQ